MDPVATPETAGDVIELLPLQTADRRIVDTAGRDVLLRGANVNSLGQYWAGIPTLGPTVPMSDADWDLMAERGFSVVRLLISWSRVEPQRDLIDEAYLDEVEAAVDAAAARGIYTVIDMHQDAYTAYLYTADPASCPQGTTPAKGWDGAPAWAVLSDGLSTCLTNGERNTSPAVTRAWNNLYDNVDGIRTEFAEAWGAEDGAPFDHIVFVEPALPAAELSRGIVIPRPPADIGLDNVSASVHNYAESILASFTIEGFNAFIESITASLGLPNWGGEYGFWDTSDATLEKARRYAADEDRHLWGGAWWQWRQSCGDPHGVAWDGAQWASFEETSTHLNLLGCPDDTDLGPNDAFLDILGRGYLRAAPGRLVEVVSDVATGQMRVKASTSTAGGQLVVWTPTSDNDSHRVRVEGLADVEQNEVPGGRIITATVSAPGDYALEIAPN